MELRDFVAVLQTKAHHGFGTHKFNIAIKTKNYYIKLKDFNLSFEETEDGTLCLTLKD